MPPKFVQPTPKKAAKMKALVVTAQQVGQVTYDNENKVLTRRIEGKIIEPTGGTKRLQGKQSVGLVPAREAAKLAQQVDDLKRELKQTIELYESGGIIPRRAAKKEAEAKKKPAVVLQPGPGGRSSSSKGPSPPRSDWRPDFDEL